VILSTESRCALVTFRSVNERDAYPSRERGMRACKASAGDERLEPCAFVDGQGLILGVTVVQSAGPRASIRLRHGSPLVETHHSGDGYGSRADGLRVD